MTSRRWLTDRATRSSLTTTRVCVLADRVTAGGALLVELGIGTLFLG